MSPQPNVGTGLLHIHACLTRALNVSIERGQEFASQGFPSAALHHGYVDYGRCLVSTLHAHHSGEEEIFFPYLAAPLPDAPYEELLSEHRRITALIDHITPAIEAVAGGANTVADLGRLVTLVQQLRDVWYPHIAKEESSFSVARLAELIPVPEHLRLLRALGEHAQKASGPDYLTVPFTLHNLSPEDRAAFGAGMPAIVTQQLVPVVWKEKWEHMRPFLLP